MSKPQSNADSRASKKIKKLPPKEVLKVLRQHRGKNSLLFMLKWGYFKLPKNPPTGFSVSSFIHQVGFWDEQKQKLWGLYIGLEKELGSAKATMAVLDLIEKRLKMPD